MGELERLTTLQVDNQSILDNNRSRDSQEMLNAINNLNRNAQPAPTGGRGRARRARSSGVTDVSGGSPSPVI
jgi:hypothetical protein